VAGIIHKRQRKLPFCSFPWVGWGGVVWREWGNVWAQLRVRGEKGGWGCRGVGWCVCVGLGEVGRGGGRSRRL
jgi:hypothetical protein